ncbi:hypothetical protein GUJ93_ZPchr0007g5939 [Zizania palustris]|uniref:Uncharacterized protein n=1 Tax=Zizania palustris TaxID=103762 RepID=A0A8J5STW0_ZIZPA|nr:hypothetical protein GUJ93_ZPchr0007g5939 [Zizania palustris]KAG8079949.1 hypothetical protein GUJ93_ZPchr0007g5939 [Zizania palustris]
MLRGWESHWRRWRCCGGGVRRVLQGGVADWPYVRGYRGSTFVVVISSEVVSVPHFDGILQEGWLRMSINLEKLLRLLYLKNVVEEVRETSCLVTLRRLQCPLVWRYYSCTLHGQLIGPLT